MNKPPKKKPRKRSGQANKATNSGIAAQTMESTKHHNPTQSTTAEVWANLITPQPSSNTVLNQKMDTLAMKLDSVVTKLSKLDVIEMKLATLDASVSDMKEDIKGLKTQTVTMDSSLTMMNETVEQNKNKLEGMEDNINDLKTTVDYLRNENDFLKKQQIDQQIRSMRDNLIFTGIQETESENTEEVLQNFLYKEMEVSAPLEFHRVHRLGANQRGKTRPIVAKFVYYKDRERIRRAAPTQLQGKRFGINEQFPKEINDRRKKLYPFYKEAKRQRKSAYFKIDKLFVEGKEIDPQRAAVTSPMFTNNHNGPRRHTSRVHNDTKQQHNPESTGSGRHNVHTMNNDIPTFSRFSPLQEEMLEATSV
jgi:hypothetical protein